MSGQAVGKGLSCSAVGGEQQWAESSRQPLNLGSPVPESALPASTLQKRRWRWRTLPALACQGFPSSLISTLGEWGDMGRGLKRTKEALKREAKIAFDSETPHRLTHSACTQMDALAGGLGNPQLEAPCPDG